VIKESIAVLLLLGIILASGLSCRDVQLEELIPTPTPTLMPTPIPSPTPTVLFSDNFNDTSSGWLTHSHESGGSAFYKSGWLHIRDNESSYYATTSYAKQHFTDFVLEVEGKLVDGQVYRDRYLQAIADFEEDYGWNFDDTLAYAKEEGDKWEQVQETLKWMSPAQKEAHLANIQDKVYMAEAIQLKYVIYLITEENWYIVRCRSDRLNNNYTFAISAEGRYFVEKTSNGIVTFLKKPSYTTHIYRGKDIINLIYIECISNTLSLSVNGHLLAKVTDNTLTSGDIELGALIVDSRYAEVAFDNIVVTTP
jgi:hypothetical protein